MTPLLPLGSTGLSCHRFGFGCYRAARGNDAHRAALEDYLDRGGNLIDTSANYGDGASEQLVGEVLGPRDRSRVIVVTKGGYIQGQNMALARERRFPEIVEYGPQIWHSIHPEFLATQVDRSLERLRQEFVDVYLLHNPEYFLEATAHRRPLTPADHDEFYRRIRAAFAYLETEVGAGRIRWYGVSSNNFNQPADPQQRSAMTSVSRCLAEAEAIDSGHHFRVVQLPLNLYEPEGALTPNNGGRTVLEFCLEHGLAVLANRPLNAYDGARLVRLADWAKPGSPPPPLEELRTRLAPLIEIEASYAAWAGEPVALASGQAVSELLLQIVPQLQSVTHWEQAAGRHVIEPVRAWLAQAAERHAERQELLPWRSDFISRVNQAFDAARQHLAARQQAVSDEVRARLHQAGYPESGEPLSRMALRVLTGLPGLSSVLAGMRRPAYVEDVLRVAEEGPELSPDECRGALLRFNSPNS